MATWKVKPPCLLVELCHSRMCAARSQLSGTLRSEGGSSKRGKLGKKGPEENSFLSPCRLPLIPQSPSHLSLFIASYLPPGPSRSLRALLILHVRLSRRPHTRLQLGKIQRLPPFPDSFQFGTEPPGQCGTAQCLHTLPY